MSVIGLIDFVRGTLFKITFIALSQLLEFAVNFCGLYTDLSMPCRSSCFTLSSYSFGSISLREFNIFCILHKVFINCHLVCSALAIEYVIVPSSRRTWIELHKEATVAKRT